MFYSKHSAQCCFPSDCLCFLFVCFCFALALLLFLFHGLLKKSPRELSCEPKTMLRAIHSCCESSMVPKPAVCSVCLPGSSCFKASSFPRGSLRLTEVSNIRLIRQLLGLPGHACQGLDLGLPVSFILPGCHGRGTVLLISKCKLQRDQLFSRATKQVVFPIGIIKISRDHGVLALELLILVMPQHKGIEKVGSNRLPILGHCALWLRKYLLSCPR